ncbi:MAG: hypothetical protein H0X29_00445 [Parachlamydiaceae bacterium]|nr:hypothetical protein [Parachlamydiaceae bacterium]
MSGLLSSDASSFTQKPIFREKLESISKPNRFNRFLIVENKKEGVTLSQTNLVRVLWEKFTGLFGHCDMTNKHLVELVTIDFLEKNKNLIDNSNNEQISQLAQRVGLKPSIGTRVRKALHLIDPHKVDQHQLLQDLINDIKGIHKLGNAGPIETITKTFKELHKAELKGFDEILNKINPLGYKPKMVLGANLTSLSPDEIQSRIQKHRSPASLADYNAVALSKGPFDTAVKAKLALQKDVLDKLPLQQRAIMIASIKEEACREVYQKDLQTCVNQGFYDPEIIPFDIENLLGKPTLITQQITTIEQVKKLLTVEVNSYLNAGKLNTDQAHRLTHDAEDISDLYLKCFNKNPEDVFFFVRDLVRIATYQEYYDKSSFNGSDHGSKHIHNNILGALSLHKGMDENHYTIKDKFIEELIHFYHDVGYTVGLASSDFNCCKDHPFIGAKMIECNRDYFLHYLDETSYTILHDCVLCHAIIRPNLSPGQIKDGIHPEMIRAVTSISDACAVTYDRKTQEFWEQTRALVALAKIKSFLILFPEYTKKLGDDIVKGKWQDYDESNPIDVMAYEVYLHVRDELRSMVDGYAIPEEKKGLFRQAIDQQFNAFKANITLGQYGAVLVGLESIPNKEAQNNQNAPTYIPQINLALSIAYGVLKDLYGEDQANDSFKKLVAEFNGDMKDLKTHLGEISQALDDGISSQDVVVATGVAQFKLLGNFVESHQDPHLKGLEDNLGQAIKQIHQVFKQQTASLSARGEVMKSMDVWIAQYKKTKTPPFALFVTESLLPVLSFPEKNDKHSSNLETIRELNRIADLLATKEIDDNNLQALKFSVAIIFMSETEYAFMRGETAITRDTLLNQTLNKTIKGKLL